MSQMDRMSKAWKQALNGSFTPWVRVDVWEGRGGKLITQGLNVVSGSLSASLGTTTPFNVSLVVADPSGTLAQGSDSPLSPYGNELNVLVGINFPTGPQWISVGWFPMVDVDPDEQFSYYLRPGEKAQKIVRRGAVVTLAAQDRSILVAQDRALTRQQPAKPTVLQEIGYLLQDVTPWAGSSLPDKAIPSGVTYNDDRLGAIATLADLLNADPVCNGAGSMGLLSREMGSTVWTVAGGDEGVMVDYRRKMTRTGVYNGAIARGQNPTTQEVIQGFSGVDSGTLKWGGKFGRAPYFQSSPFLTTQSSVDAAAVTTRDRVVGNLSATMAITCVGNPGIDLGDVIDVRMPRGILTARVVGFDMSLPPLDGMKLTVQADPDSVDRVS